MTYIRKTVSFLKDDYEQLSICIEQLLESIDTLQELYEKKLNYSDYLKATMIYANILKKFKRELSDTYNLKQIKTLERIGIEYEKNTD